MAFEMMTPGCALTERDIVEVLKSGKDGRLLIEEHARNLAGYSLCSRDDLIESLMLSSREMLQAVPANRGKTADRVCEIPEEVRRLLTERRRLIEMEMRDLYYTDRIVLLVWEGYHRLDPDGRRILESYYLDREPAALIAERMEISESTFWRKRRTAVRNILKFCENRNQGHVMLSQKTER